jgi:uncharacterized protein HemX
MNDAEQAAREFRGEVDAEAARLIRIGVPPWDAAIQARQRVSRRRLESAQADPAGATLSEKGATESAHTSSSSAHAGREAE